MMDDYLKYLETQNYSPTTIKDYASCVQLFKKWCRVNNTSPIQIDYKTSLKYIKFLNKKNTSKHTVNHRLSVVKNYFNYLVNENIKLDNPLKEIVVKGGTTAINHYLLKQDELEDLYYSFNIETQNKYHKNRALRNKVILGLMVYQGLSTTDLGHLNIDHLQLHKGKVYVPSSKKINTRTIDLKPWQIIDFITYTTQVRPVLQKRLHNYSEQLFPTNARFSSVIHELIKKLKHYNQKVTGIKQIRASVITLWLDHYNLRETQYYAGHRYISSTEKYLQDDLENLHELINNFHPIS